MNQVIGHSQKRVTGKFKVTGGARYAAEFPIENITHGVLTTSTIAKGRIINIDTKDAQAVPGVLAIITYQNAPKLPSDSISQAEPPPEEYFQALYTERIYFYGQPVAVTVAETLEQAEQAASLIRVQYQEEQHKINLEQAIASGELITSSSQP
ncbi:MAG: xanthine dehydrogenase family protein molybdopterin-binding subunit, partial [Waterburya sp.]